MFFCLKTDHGFVCFFFFNDTATTEIYTLSLHDALPISIPKAGADHSRSGRESRVRLSCGDRSPGFRLQYLQTEARDRKSTRLNSSHLVISYAVFCLKKKNDMTLVTNHTPYPRTTRLK